MSNKTRYLCFLLTVVGLVSLLNAEVIKISLLKQAKKEFSIKRDLFTPGGVPAVGQSRVQEPRPEEKSAEEKEKEEDLEGEVRRSIAFEGYILKNNKGNALVNVNGEFFVAVVGDILKDKIKIIDIESKILTIEVESKIFQIQLKGDKNEENE